MRKLLYLTLVLSLAASCREAEVRLPVTIGDGMILQREVPLTIRGQAAPGSRVKVTWRGDRFKARTGKDSLWSVSLPAAAPGGPFTMKINGKVISDILVGDVFLCSGQSNMELPVSRCLDAVGEVVSGYENDHIRYLHVPRQYDFDGPMRDLSLTHWQKLSPDETAMDWGAVSYFTARALFDKTGVPVGMVNASVGGSPIEAWMPERVLPGYALEELLQCKDKEWLDSIRNFNANLYDNWQNAHNALLPSNSKWRRIKMFDSSWAVDGKGENIYGSHFLRRRFSLAASEAGCPGVLHLGAMTDADSTFVNGVFVGNTTYMYPPRNYNVPKGVLKEGENEIEVHLYATGGNHAAFVPDKQYALETSGGTVSLLEGWEYREGRRMPARPGEVFLHYKAAGLYNGMIAPLAPYRFAGVIWYQGESNCGNAPMYGTLLTDLISSWRDGFSDADLPFYIIELAAFEHSELTDNDWGWNRVQKEQRRTAETVPGTWLVPNGDIGEWNDIHPQDKKTVGERTADVILKSKN